MLTENNFLHTNKGNFMKNNTMSDEKIAFNKKQSEINKDSQVSCCLWGDQDGDNCSGKIISAHSIQRGKILESIAENGKVSYLTLDTTNDLTKINPAFKLEGIKKFSTFFGFCGKHDKDIFQPIEDRIFNGEKDQLNRYAYRAVCKELHAQMVSLKKNELLLGNDINGKCPPHFLLFYPDIQSGKVVVPDFIRELKEKEIMMEKLREKVKGIELNIQELSMLENHLKSVIKNQDNSLIEHKLYTFDYNIPIACSSVFFQYIDPLGKVILSENDTESLGDISDCKRTILNIFPENGKTYVIFSVIKTNNKVIKFIDDLFMDKDNFDWKLSHIILNHIENIAFNPSYIDGFSDDEKNEILAMFFHNVNNPLSYHKSSISLFRKQ